MEVSGLNRLGVNSVSIQVHVYMVHFKGPHDADEGTMASKKAPMSSTHKPQPPCCSAQWLLAAGCMFPVSPTLDSRQGFSTGIVAQSGSHRPELTEPRLTADDMVEWRTPVGASAQLREPLSTFALNIGKVLSSRIDDAVLPTEQIAFPVAKFFPSWLAFAVFCSFIPLMVYEGPAGWNTRRPACRCARQCRGRTCRQVAAEQRRVPPLDSSC